MTFSGKWKSPKSSWLHRHSCPEKINRSKINSFHRKMEKAKIKLITQTHHHRKKNFNDYSWIIRNVCQWLDFAHCMEHLIRCCPVFTCYRYDLVEFDMRRNMLELLWRIRGIKSDITESVVKCFIDSSGGGQYSTVQERALIVSTGVRTHYCISKKFIVDIRENYVVTLCKSPFS